MTRFLYLAAGILLGAIGTGVIASRADTPTMDPVALSPQYYKIRLDDEAVRVLEFHLRPGGKEVMHSHPCGVVLTLADAIVKNTSPDGSATTRHVAQGDVEWSNAVTHTGENVGTSEAHFYRVELKNCRK